MSEPVYDEIQAAKEKRAKEIEADYQLAVKMFEKNPDSVVDWYGMMILKCKRPKTQAE